MLPNSEVKSEDIKAINTALQGGLAKIAKKQKLDGNPTKQGITEVKSKGYILQDFRGKKLRHDKSYYEKGYQEFVRKGTKWEDISSDFRQKIHFSLKDFN